MMEIALRRVLSPIEEVEVPSISIDPLVSHSTRRKRAARREDLPAPVRPTTPTFIPGST